MQTMLCCYLPALEFERCCCFLLTYPYYAALLQPETQPVILGPATHKPPCTWRATPTETAAYVCAVYSETSGMDSSSCSVHLAVSVPRAKLLGSPLTSWHDSLVGKELHTTSRRTSSSHQLASISPPTPSSDEHASCEPVALKRIFTVFCQ